MRHKCHPEFGLKLLSRRISCKGHIINTLKSSNSLSSVCINCIFFGSVILIKYYPSIKIFLLIFNLKILLNHKFQKAHLVRTLKESLITVLYKFIIYHNSSYFCCFFKYSLFFLEKDCKIFF